MVEPAKEVSELMAGSTPTSALMPLKQLRRLLPEDQRHRDTRARWIINDLMREGAVITVCGLPGSFKSFLVLDAVLAIANNQPEFLGQPVKHGPVLFICADDGVDTVIDRLKMIARYRLGTEAYDNIDLVDRGELNLIGSGADFLISNTVVAMQQDYGRNPALIVIDTAAMAGIPTEDFGHSVPGKLGWLKRAAAECHCCIVLVDHVSRHGDSDIDIRSKTWGSVLKAGFFEGVWWLEKQGDFVLLKAADKRASKEYELFLKFGNIDGVYSMEYSDIKGDPAKDAIVELLCNEGESLSVTTIAKQLNMNEMTVRRKVNELVEQGEILVREQGAGRRSTKYGKGLVV